LKRATIEEAISRKYPEAVVMVVTMDASGRPNAMPAGWCMFTSGNPPMLAVSISPKRHTHRLLSLTGEFVVAFPGEGQEELIEFCGTKSGRDVDKFGELSIRTQPSSLISPPLIEGSVACLECRASSTLETGDHTIFAGRILAAHVSEKPVRRLYNLGGAGPDRYRALVPEGGLP